MSARVVSPHPSPPPFPRTGRHAAPSFRSDPSSSSSRSPPSGKKRKAGASDVSAAGRGAKSPAGKKPSAAEQAKADAAARAQLAPPVEAPKKRFKSAMHHQLAGREPPRAPEDIALAQAIQRDGERVETIRARRDAAAKEVTAAEQNLMEVKTSVEDAEAIYNNVRAELAAGHGYGDDHDDDEHHVEDDWDKYLHFGDHDHGDDDGGAGSTPRRGNHETEDGDDGDPDCPVSAAAKAARSLASGYGGDVQSPAAAAAMQGAVEAAVRVHGNHHEPHHGHGAHGHAQGHGAPHSPTRGLRSGAENPHHHAFRPSLQEAEAFLLSELKKLELANARLMTAREHLGEITRQLQEAVRAAEVNLLARERRDAAAMDAGASSRDEDDGKSNGAGVAAGGDDVDDDANGKSDGDASGGARRGGVSSRRPPGGVGGGGGKVIEDRRFGIYDSRRYRMEGEPAPPDPSDDEGVGASASIRGRGASANARVKSEEDELAVRRGKPSAATTDPRAEKEEEKKKKKTGTIVSADAEIRPGGGRGRGRGSIGGRYATAGGRGGGRTGATGRKIEAGPGYRAGDRRAGFQFRNEDGAAREFSAPSAADAATYVARGGGLRWRMKRPRTRQTVGRPAMGPTSWSAACGFALWRGGEMAARVAARSAGDDDECDDGATDDSDRDEDDRDEVATIGGESMGGESMGGESISHPWDDDDIIFDDFPEDDDGVVDVGMMIDMNFD